MGCMLDEQTIKILLVSNDGRCCYFVSLYLQDCSREQSTVFNTAPLVSPYGDTSRVDQECLGDRGGMY